MVKAFRLLGHIYFLVLLVLAGVYYLERTIILDSALQIFKWIQFTGFNIEAGRVSAIIPQIIPKILIWCGVPLKMVLFSASVSFILIFYLAFIISVYKLRSLTAGLCIVLALTLCSLRTFYFSVVEVHQALVYPFLFLAWLEFNTNKRSISFLLGASIILALNFLTHPTTLMTTLFILGYHVIEQRETKSKWPYLIIGFMIVFFAIRWLFFSVSAYESGLYDDALLVAPALENLWNLPGIRFILDQVWTNNTLFLIPSIMFVWSIFALIREKKWLLSIFSLTSILLFILISSITYQRGDSAMMMEKNFLALGVFISLVFVKEVLFSKRMGHRVAFIIALAIVALKIRDISLEGAKMAKPRLAFIYKAVEAGRQQHGQKFIVDKEDLPDEIKVDWGLPIESLLLSSIDGEESITLMTRSEYLLYKPDSLNVELFIVPHLWHSGNSSDLNDKYFSFSQGKYRYLSIEGTE